MKKNRTFARKGNKAQKPSRPFEGKIKQLRKEHVILISLADFEGFRDALIDEDIDYDLGDYFGSGIIFVEK